MTPLEEAYACASSYCSSAEHCTKEVLTKLARFELSDEQREGLLERLRAEGFLNETRYAWAFVNDAFRFNKWGRLKIKQGLRMKGVSERVILDALAQLDDEVYETTLMTLLRQKQRQLPGKDGRDLRARLYRFALGRGFENGLVLSCIKRLLPGTDGNLED
ncbi:MAG TPA: RecX family transcriptional regulator [Bacteroidales bacterium]|nr:RecX family transcriptional regulator [Bacteroidales bacterium]